MSVVCTVRTGPDPPISGTTIIEPNKLKDGSVFLFQVLHFLNCYVFVEGISIKETLFQLCIKDSPDRIKPHTGLVLNIITKHVESKGCDITGISLLNLFLRY